MPSIGGIHAEQERRREHRRTSDDDAYRRLHEAKKTISAWGAEMLEAERKLKLQEIYAEAWEQIALQLCGSLGFHSTEWGARRTLVDYIREHKYLRMSLPGTREIFMEVRNEQGEKTEHSTGLSGRSDGREGEHADPSRGSGDSGG